ncbi:MAG TPA: ferritin-like domain-containing protein [Gemmatimonadaceae bacterium]|nr:ferritin-like domain-containing protein [Gemmatimonadaceae bacterium]
MELNNLRALYIDELKDLYSAEKQLVKALPKMAKNATNPQLKQAFTDHLAETEDQVQRLEEIFGSLEASPGGKKCVGMEGLIEEAKELIGEDPQEDVLDAGLISKAQHVEHYEMAGYGTVRTYAELLGETRHAQLLQQTLDEEGNANKLLTQLAESSINTDAAIGDQKSDVSSVSANGRGDREVSRTVRDESRNTRSSTTKGRTRSSTSETSSRA